MPYDSKVLKFLASIEEDFRYQDVQWKWAAEELTPDMCSQRDEQGRTVLLYVAMIGHGEAVMWLLQNGKALINERDNHGRTALLSAVLGRRELPYRVTVDGSDPYLNHSSYSLDMVKWLLTQGGACIDERDNNGRTALLCAAAGGHIELVRWLLTEGRARVDDIDNSGATVLLLAAASYTRSNSNGAYIIASLLRGGGASVNRTRVNKKDNTGTTALMHVAANGVYSKLSIPECGLGGQHIAFGSFLIRKGAVVNEKDNSGATALLYAAKNGHVSTVKLLLQDGANINERDNSGATALLHAAVNGHVDTVDLLLRKGVDLKDIDNEGRTALVLAAQKNHLKMVCFLLARAPLDIEDSLILFLQQYVLENVENIFKICRREGVSYFLLLLQSVNLSENQIDSALEKMQHFPEIKFEWRKRIDLREGQGISFETKKIHFRRQLQELVEPNILFESREKLIEKMKGLAGQMKATDELKTLIERCVEPCYFLDFSPVIPSRLPFIKNVKSPEDFFRPLDEFLEGIKEYRRAYESDKDYAEVLLHLEVITEFYLAYRKRVYVELDKKSFKDLANEDQLRQLQFKLTKPRYMLTGADLQHAYLKEEVVAHLAPEEGESVVRRRDPKLTGNHTVIHYGGIHFKYHYDMMPCYPGMEYLVGEFYNLLTHSDYGIAPTTLLRLHSHNYSQLIVASQTVPGFTLEEFFENYVKTEADLQRINTYSFSAVFFTSLVTNPQDAKQDNSMAKFISSPERQEGYSFGIIGIDNDMAFEPPIVREDQDKYSANVKCIFYFFPQMQERIDPKFRDQFKSQIIEVLMIDWLIKTQEQNKFYKRLAKSMGVSEEELRELRLPISFIPGIVKGMIVALKKLQSYLFSHPRATHDDFFHYLQPELAAYYDKIRQLPLPHREKPQHPILEHLGVLYDDANFFKEKKSPVQLEVAHPQSAIPNKSVLAREQEYPSQSLAEAINELVESIDFSKISVDKQRLILTKLKELTCLKRLTLRNITALDDRLLRNLLSSLPSLEEIHLIHCPHITSEALILEKKRLLPLKVGIYECKMKSADYTKLITQSQTQINLLLLYQTAEKKYRSISWVSGTDPNSCLQEILLENGTLSFDQLRFLMSQKGFDINRSCPTVERGSPLHVAAKHQNIAMVHRLMFFGADVQVRDLQSQKTPFQKLLKYGLFKTCKLLESQDEQVAAVTIQRTWRSQYS